MVIRGSMVVWCEPMKRGDLKLAPGDVADALTWFKQTTGQDARLIVLHPKNERCAKEAGDSVKVQYLSGCLAWEVWLSAKDTFYNTPSQIGAEGPTPVVKSRGGKMLPPYRPRVFGEEVDRKIEALAAEGLGARAIYRFLKGQGIGISLSSISKRLQHYRHGGKA